mgnify:CR=1 FL=1
MRVFRRLSRLRFARCEGIVLPNRGSECNSLPSIVMLLYLSSRSFYATLLLTYQATNLPICQFTNYQSTKPGWMSMRRMVVFLLIVLIFLSSSAIAWAGPRALPRPQAARAVITSPEPFTTLRGRVSISGTALHPQFQRYELYYKAEPGESWIFIGEAHFEQVDNGLLGTWDTISLADGAYSLLLRVVRRDGNYEEYFVRQLLVANAQPTETPTPEVSPTPTETPTPLPPTPTVVVEQPVVIPTAMPQPTPTPTPEGSAPAVVSENEEGGLFGLGQLTSQIDLNSIGKAFVLGAEYALAAFVAVGLFFALKRFLGWLWARIRG